MHLHLNLRALFVHANNENKNHNYFIEYYSSFAQITIKLNSTLSPIIET